MTEAQNELQALRDQYMEVGSAVFSARNISRDDLKTASWCLHTAQTAIDDALMYDFDWPQTRAAILAHRKNLPAMKHKRIAKMVGDLLDDIIEWTDAREAQRALR